VATSLIPRPGELDPNAPIAPHGAGGAWGPGWDQQYSGHGVGGSWDPMVYGAPLSPIGALPATGALAGEAMSTAQAIPKYGQPLPPLPEDPMGFRKEWPQKWDVSKQQWVENPEPGIREGPFLPSGRFEAQHEPGYRLTGRENPNAPIWEYYSSKPANVTDLSQIPAVRVMNKLNLQGMPPWVAPIESAVGAVRRYIGQPTDPSRPIAYREPRE